MATGRVRDRRTGELRACELCRGRGRTLTGRACVCSGGERPSQRTRTALKNASAVIAGIAEQESGGYVTAKDTAVLVRGVLAEEFPDTKFSVKTDKYAGGASLRVRWTDGPTKQEVEEFAKTFQGASFDGSTDMKSHHRTAIDVGGEVREVQTFADFVFCDRDLSDELIDRLTPAIRQNGRNDRPQPCRACGNWMPEGDCYTARSERHGSEWVEFVCSQRCGALIEAGNPAVNPGSR